MEEEEIWKDIPGYEGLYQASSFGRVKSLERLVDVGWCIRPKYERILVPNLSKNGYYKNTLSINKTKKQISVHQIMAITFLGHTIDKFNIVVNHIDGNRLNNALSNLELVTHRVNTTRRYRADHERVTSKYPGVYWDKYKNKWIASLYMNGKQVRLGVFKTEIAASVIYEDRLAQYEKEIIND